MLPFLPSGLRRLLGLFHLLACLSILFVPFAAAFLLCLWHLCCLCLVQSSAVALCSHGSVGQPLVNQPARSMNARICIHQSSLQQGMQLPNQPVSIVPCRHNLCSVTATYAEVDATGPQEVAKHSFDLTLGRNLRPWWLAMRRVFCHGFGFYMVTRRTARLCTVPCSPCCNILVLAHAVTTRSRRSGRAMQPHASRHPHIKMVASACDISVTVDVKHIAFIGDPLSPGEINMRQVFPCSSQLLLRQAIIKTNSNCNVCVP